MSNKGRTIRNFDGNPSEPTPLPAETPFSIGADSPHRHRYGLVPVWKVDGNAIESWWWCTDHPAGEWAKIEDDADAAEAIPVRGADSPAGLDVERLAKALMLTVGTVGWMRFAPPHPVEEWLANAEAIAAEYLRLRDPARSSDE